MRTNTVTVVVAVTVTAQVVMAWIFDVPLTLDFQPFETATVFLAVIIVNVIMANGKSTYLDGLMLLSLYFFISLGFIMHDPEEAHCIQDQLWCV
jgi:Ca2+:H+ antiporter